MTRFQNRAELERDQSRRLAQMLRELLRVNPFVREKFAGVSAPDGGPPRVEDLPSLPLTRKQELVEDQETHPPYGRNHCYPETAYTRIHQTSGTTGQPLFWLDTRDSWQWFIDTWKDVLRPLLVSDRDRVYLAFSFGPFLGFWGAFEAAHQLGALTITGGAQTSEQRLDQILHRRATIVVSTPTYALHLAEVARRKGLDLEHSEVRALLHAGEPGASVTNVRKRLEGLWGARVYDHAGATEVGAWGIPGDEEDCLLINEDEFIAEVIDRETLLPAARDDQGVRRGELVLTNLGRFGSPVIRYRTGDVVALENETTADQPPVARLRGGVLGRVDDMLVVRGVNIYPSAIENLVRVFEDIAEFQLVVDRSKELIELEIRVETSESSTAEHLEALLRERLSLRTTVHVVTPGSLPRFELKAKRLVFVDAQ